MREVSPWRCWPPSSPVAGITGSWITPESSAAGAGICGLSPLTSCTSCSTANAAGVCALPLLAPAPLYAATSDAMTADPTLCKLPCRTPLEACGDMPRVPLAWPGA